MDDPDADLLAHLRALEVELQQPAARAHATRLDALLRPDFLEVGRSGTAYSKREIVARLTGDAAPPDIVADRFALRRLADDVALLTYRSAQRGDDGALVRHTLRASVWQRTGADWQVSFHQGTATAPFADND